MFIILSKDVIGDCFNPECGPQYVHPDTTGNASCNVTICDTRYDLRRTYLNDIGSKTLMTKYQYQSRIQLKMGNFDAFLLIKLFGTIGNSISVTYIYT